MYFLKIVKLLISYFYNYSYGSIMINIDFLSKWYCRLNVRNIYVCIIDDDLMNFIGWVITGSKY